jgi:hypothetical protein
MRTFVDPLSLAMPSAVPDAMERYSPTLSRERKMSVAARLKRYKIRSNQGGITMSQFVYLYRGAEHGRSPDKMQEMMQKWMTWMKQLTDQGHIKDPGQPLEHTGKLVKGKQKTVTDGPFAETKDIVGGYTLIEARDLDQAVELSKGCPIFEVEGAVEVRPVMKMNM